MSQCLARGVIGIIALLVKFLLYLDPQRQKKHLKKDRITKHHPLLLTLLQKERQQINKRLRIGRNEELKSSTYLSTP